MAVTLSKNSQISIGGTAVGQLMGWDYSETDTQIDTTNFDSTRREFLNAGLLDGDVNIEAQFDLGDTGQDGIRAALGGVAVAIIIYPDGNTSSKPTLTGTVLVGSHSVTASGVEDVINVSFSGKLSALVEGTV